MLSSVMGVRARRRRASSPAMGDRSASSGPGEGGASGVIVVSVAARVPPGLHAVPASMVARTSAACSATACRSTSGGVKLRHWGM